jgi:hypothetical protein
MSLPIEIREMIWKAAFHLVPIVKNQCGIVAGFEVNWVVFLVIVIFLCHPSKAQCFLSHY